MFQAQRVEDSLDVNFIARAQQNHMEECAAALAKVSKTALTTAKEVTPGSEVELRYLSPSQVGAYEPPMTAYTANNVLDSFKAKRKLRDGVVSDHPAALLPVVNAVQVCR